MPSTETRPVETDTDTGEGDGYAHYADKTEITRRRSRRDRHRAVWVRFPPVRDPQRFPVCPRCKELAALLWGPE